MTLSQAVCSESALCPLLLKQTTRPQSSHHVCFWAHVATLTMDYKPPHVLGIPNKGGMQLEGKSGDGKVTEKDSALGSKGKDQAWGGPVGRTGE